MDRYFSRVLLLLIGFAVGCGMFPRVVSALSVSPSLIEARANPGETANVSVTIKNDERVALSIYPTLQKFLPRGTEGQQQFLPNTDLAGIPSWTFIGMRERVLQPGESTIVPVQIRVPSDAPQGGAYEALFFSGQPPLAERGAVGFRSRIGTLILLTVGNATTTELVVSDWRLTESVRNALRGSVQVGLKNAGNTHVTPQGEVVIRGLFGNEVRRLPLNPGGARVLPASERAFTVSFGSSAFSGAVAGLGAELSDWGVGRYTLSLEGVTGVVIPPEPITVTVWPWHVLGVVGGCGVVLLLLLRLYRYRLLKALQAPRS